MPVIVPRGILAGPQDELELVGRGAQFDFRKALADAEIYRADEHGEVQAIVVTLSVIQADIAVDQLASLPDQLGEPDQLVFQKEQQVVAKRAGADKIFRRQLLELQLGLVIRVQVQLMYPADQMLRQTGALLVTHLGS